MVEINLEGVALSVHNMHFKSLVVEESTDWEVLVASIALWNLEHILS